MEEELSLPTSWLIKVVEGFGDDFKHPRFAILRDLWSWGDSLGSEIPLPAVEQEVNHHIVAAGFHSCSLCLPQNKPRKVPKGHLVPAQWS
jgi:hypothetical protein